MRETLVQSLGQEDSLEKEMAIHSSTHASKIPWTEDPGRLQSMGSQRVGHDWVTSLSHGRFMLRFDRKQNSVKQLSFNKKNKLKKKTWFFFWFWSLTWEDSLKEKMANHCNMLAWKIPGTEKSGQLESIGLHRVGHHWTCMNE